MHPWEWFALGYAAGILTFTGVALIVMAKLTAHW